MLFPIRIIKVKQPIYFQIFRKFSALEVDDDYYEFPREISSLNPPICPVCSKFLDNKECQYMPVSNMCPLDSYNKNKNIINSLIEQLEKKKR